MSAAETLCLLCGLRRAHPTFYAAALMQRQNNEIPLINAAAKGHPNCLQELATYTNATSLQRAASGCISLAENEECRRLAQGWLDATRDYELLPWLPK